MSPPRGGRGLDDEIYARRRRKRKRTVRKQHRRRAAVLAIVAIFGLLFVVAGAAVTGVATFGSNCDLNALRPIAIGQNSFIYAANNSILGAIPAERNRQPVPLSRISAWMPLPSSVAAPVATSAAPAAAASSSSVPTASVADPSNVRICVENAPASCH